MNAEATEAQPHSGKTTYRIAADRPWRCMLSTGTVLDGDIANRCRVTVDLWPHEVAELATTEVKVNPGFLPAIATVGPTELRPQAATKFPGHQYFDTTLDRPIYVNAECDGLVDASGLSV